MRVTFSLLFAFRERYESFFMLVHFFPSWGRETLGWHRIEGRRKDVEIEWAFVVIQHEMEMLVSETKDDTIRTRLDG